MTEMVVSSPSYPNATLNKAKRLVFVSSRFNGEREHSLHLILTANREMA